MSYSCSSNHIQIFLLKLFWLPQQLCLLRWLLEFPRRLIWFLRVWKVPNPFLREFFLPDWDQSELFHPFPVEMPLGRRVKLLPRNGEPMSSRLDHWACQSNPSDPEPNRYLLDHIHGEQKTENPLGFQPVQSVPILQVTWFYLWFRRLKLSD